MLCHEERSKLKTAFDTTNPIFDSIISKISKTTYIESAERHQSLPDPTSEY